MRDSQGTALNLSPSDETLIQYSNGLILGKTRNQSRGYLTNSLFLEVMPYFLPSVGLLLL